MNTSERGEPRKAATIGSLSILTLLVSFTTGVAAVGGSVLGTGLGRSVGSEMRSAGLFTGAAAGGMLGVALAVQLATRMGMLPRSRARAWAAFVGGVLGFALAIPIATRHLNGPLVPIACAFLPGIGAAVASLIASPNSTRP
jgi:hypothetical protein